MPRFFFVFFIGVSTFHWLEFYSACKCWKAWITLSFLDNLLTVSLVTFCLGGVTFVPQPYLILIHSQWCGLGYCSNTNQITCHLCLLCALLAGFFIYIKILIYIKCVCPCVYMWIWGGMKARKEHQVPWSWRYGRLCELWMWVLGLSSNAPQEQQVLLVT